MENICDKAKAFCKEIQASNICDPVEGENKSDVCLVIASEAKEDGHTITGMFGNGESLILALSNAFYKNRHLLVMAQVAITIVQANEDTEKEK